MAGFAEYAEMKWACGQLFSAEINAAYKYSRIRIHVERSEFFGVSVFFKEVQLRHQRTATLLKDFARTNAFSFPIATEELPSLTYEWGPIDGVFDVATQVEKGVDAMIDDLLIEAKRAGLSTLVDIAESAKNEQKTILKHFDRQVEYLLNVRSLDDQDRYDKQMWKRFERMCSASPPFLQQLDPEAEDDSGCEEIADDLVDFMNGNRR